jgi:type IV pilus assembly protein PilE
MYRYKRAAGFTLIELMLVVALIGILAAIAVPAYQEYGRKARRADAKQALTALQLQQEKWRASNIRYTTTLMPNLNWQHSVAGTPVSQNQYYNLAITSAAATAYNMTAAPRAGGRQVGDRCGTFAINQNGNNTTGSYANSDCWK